MRLTLLAVVFLLCLYYADANSVLGATNTPLNGATITFNNICKVCEIDCTNVEDFGVSNKVLTCKYRYYRYGCHINSHCFHLESTSVRDFYGALAFCFMFNDCSYSDIPAVASHDPGSRVRNFAHYLVKNNVAPYKDLPAFTVPYDYSCSPGPTADTYTQYNNLLSQLKAGTLSPGLFLLYATYPCPTRQVFFHEYMWQVLNQMTVIYNIDLKTRNPLEIAVKATFMDRISVDKFVFIYYKIINTVIDNWSGLMNNSTKRTNFANQYCALIQKIPLFSAEGSGNGAYTRASSAYCPTATDILNLKYQKPIRLVALMDMINRASASIISSSSEAEKSNLSYLQLIPLEKWRPLVQEYANLINNARTGVSATYEGYFARITNVIGPLDYKTFAFKKV